MDRGAWSDPQERGDGAGEGFELGLDGGDILGGGGFVGLSLHGIGTGGLRALTRGGELERLDLAASGRASFSVFTTTDDIDALAAGLREVQRVFGA